MNPAVTLVICLRGVIGTDTAIACVIAQLVGGILGVGLAIFGQSAGEVA